ncbi:unnamed protein product [Diatraea saccharalis]|uniref:Neugrin n=1 Tax=Diatraea saccharalis TaxID=40085 RepID=A0A9N9R772_9NEOP|nr:unnamed protein product [Diatraea saccharalis]
MFSVRLQQLIYICDKIVIRNLRNSRIHYPNADPGLGRRLKAFQDSSYKIEDEDAEEFIEASESDFSNVGEAYNEHMNETLMGKYELGYDIVKQKYFKENMPNLLTWSEKEQIRHLVASAPDEWTPEKIAESFPVTVPVVKKLIKYPWKPATEQRIARHDASVMRNWRELKEGTFSIPDELKNHFLKFSERSIPTLNKSSIKVDVTQEEKMGEFEKIVQRCAAKENSENKYNLDSTHQETNSQESNKKKYSKRMTLKQLTEKIQKRLDSGKDIDMNDEILIKSMSSNKAEIQATVDSSEIELRKPNDDSKMLTEFKTDNLKNEKDIMDYPERIRIPKKAYKKGATYKVNDCYYDHDGKFLYRVLGMST